jgi:hypothetical protein
MTLAWVLYEFAVQLPQGVPQNSKCNVAEMAL